MTLCIAAYCAIAMGYPGPYTDAPSIIATGTIERIYADVRPTSRPTYKPRRSVVLKPTATAYAASLPKPKAPFEALIGNRGLKLAKVDGDEVINRFTPGMTRILKDVQAKFGCKIEVQSGYRSPARNRAVGGVKRSYHMSGRAADIRVPCASKETLLKYLRSNPRVGGIGFYMAGGFIHADDGRRREWRY
jgi:hypothetical protein